jgi:pimeloyl-ACP methyl ester carboxylesterase
LFWIIAAIIIGLLLIPVLGLLGVWLYIYIYFLKYVVRIFQERPLFAINRGQPEDGVEDFTIEVVGGSVIRACLLPSFGPRRGVVLFSPEFGSNRWSCREYSPFLREAGYDVIGYEPRGQGESDGIEGYQPLHWVTDYEVADVNAVLGWLKSRYGDSISGIGVIGLSKGAGAATVAAAGDRYICCLVTDGMFAIYTTVVPYMRQWVRIYSKMHWLHNILPDWFYGSLAYVCCWRVERERHCRFSQVETALRKLGNRPLLMINGEKDSYIRSTMAMKLFDIACRSGKASHQFWLAPGARHNEAIARHPQEYKKRVLEFFDANLGSASNVLDKSVQCD